MNKRSFLVSEKVQSSGRDGKEDSLIAEHLLCPMMARWLYSSGSQPS